MICLLQVYVMMLSLCPKNMYAICEMRKLLENFAECPKSDSGPWGGCTNICNGVQYRKRASTNGQIECVMLQEEHLVIMNRVLLFHK